VRVKQAAYMADHLGDEYTGVISGVMSFGFFVRLDRLGVEGLVRVSSIDDDFYRYDEPNYRLVGSRTKRVYRLGDPVRVGVMKVDRTRNEIDLFLIRPEKEPAKPKKQAKKKTREKKRGRKRS
jgi:ribonuclease R